MNKNSSIKFDHRFNLNPSLELSQHLDKIDELIMQLIVSIAYFDRCASYTEATSIYRRSPRAWGGGDAM